MDFFDYQDRARRKTWHLVTVFVIGVLLTVLLVNLLGYAIYYAFFLYVDGRLDASLMGWLQSNYSWQLSLGAVLIILAGSLAAYLQLRQGGEVVARWASARLIDYDSKDPAERQFVNVVEEMAIASGSPVPQLYVMHNEPAINAFVAGYRPDQAVMVVSQGTLEHLNRQELQGVVGHEFSHILNGDMRLNVRLMAALAGLIQIGQIGRFLFRSAFYRSYGRRRNSRDSGAQLAIPVLGLGLILIGYIGVLTGRLIKAAVSRQREYLADASAVQFTRDPDGIAGALYKIREHQFAGQLQHRHAEDMSHFCFADSISLSGMLATHPPLDERIKRVNPTYITRARHRKVRDEAPEAAVSRTQPAAFDQVMGVAAIAAMAGTVTPAHLDYARQLYRHIPEQVRTLVHQSAGARAWCYGLVMLFNKGHEQTILDEIKQSDREAAIALQRLWPFCQQLDAQLRLPILELAMPMLKRLDERATLVFLDRIDRFIKVNNQTVLQEWVLYAQLRHHLLTPEGRKQQESISIHACAQALRILLSALVYQNRETERAAARYEQVAAPFDWPEKSLLPEAEAGFTQVSDALEQLARVPFFWRRSIIQACVDIIQADGDIHQEEYDLVRTIADCLGCPMPPLIEREWQRSLD
ncbi:MAG: M48 family metalloprotease [Saccharospirillum sp.]|nr:M48 family metalloprotease [Saccharospirillum sp.]